MSRFLKTLPPGDIVVLDNLGSHKSKEVRAMLRRVGAKLVFLPPCRPDLNRIEQLFSKLKDAMRKAMARTVQAVHDALATTLETIRPSECKNYLANAGYKST